MGKVRTSANARAKYKPIDIDEEYIRSTIEFQNNRDYYTGLPFNSPLDMSVDRIDSSLGYVKGNIVITTCIINSMKNDLSINEFKEYIRNIYNNIDNF